jgi:hypothetical protein
VVAEFATLLDQRAAGFTVCADDEQVQEELTSEESLDDWMRRRVFNRIEDRIRVARPGRGRLVLKVPCMKIL